MGFGTDVVEAIEFWRGGHCIACCPTGKRTCCDMEEWTTYECGATCGDDLCLTSCFKRSEISDLNALRRGKLHDSQSTYMVTADLRKSFYPSCDGASGVAGTITLYGSREQHRNRGTILWSNDLRAGA